MNPHLTYKRTYAAKMRAALAGVATIPGHAVELIARYGDEGLDGLDERECDEAIALAKVELRGRHLESFGGQA